MTTAFYSHPDCLSHDTPPDLPEQVARVQRIEEAVRDFPLDRRLAPLCEDADILLCHPQRYLDHITSSVPETGRVALEEETFLSPGSLAAARRAVGGGIAAIEAVLAGEVKNAFVACRPPGHHAEAETPMGFCIFGNVAIAARHAMERHGLTRVAIVDFDVHHGNGTQALLWDEPRALFFSSQEHPQWPGTGAEDERGAHDQIVNLRLPTGTGGAEMRAAYAEKVMTRIDAFAPELILISAGFDAHQADPLAGLNWTEEDYVWITHQLCDLADKHCQGRVVSTLEGGYDLTALAASAAAHVQVLLERGA